MEGVGVFDPLDDSSSWHSAFDPPCPDLGEPERVDGGRKPKRSRAPRVHLCSSSDEVERRRAKKPKKRVKKHKKSRKRRSVRRSKVASSDAEGIEDPLDATKGESSAATMLDQGDSIFDFLFTVRRESGPVRPSAAKSTACAKVLVRSGLRWGEGGLDFCSLCPEDAQDSCLYPGHMPTGYQVELSFAGSTSTVRSFPKC